MYLMYKIHGSAKWRVVMQAGPDDNEEIIANDLDIVAAAGLVHFLHGGTMVGAENILKTLGVAV